MRSPLYLAVILGTAVLAANPASAQVTYGKKPELPAPFATQTVGNGPDHAKPPAGFWPTVPPVSISAYSPRISRFRDFWRWRPMVTFFLPIQGQERSTFCAIHNILALPRRQKLLQRD